MVTQVVPILGVARLVVTYDTDEAVAALEAIRTRTRQRGALWGKVGDLYRESYRRTFAAGGRPEWEALRPSTIAKKTKFLSGKPTPPYTKSGKPPKRLLQNGSFGPETKLIERGMMRDSFVQKGSKGHVEEVGPRGDSLFIGSQLTVERELSPYKPVKKYFLMSKKAKKARAAGQSATVRISLPRLHQEGTSKMVARPIAVILDEDTKALAKAAKEWVMGSP